MSEASGQGSGALKPAPIVVAVVPDQPPRVLEEAARLAEAIGCDLVVVHVDTSRFVEGVDPNGWASAAPAAPTGAADFAAIEAAAAAVLDGHAMVWRARQLIGDPALALAHLGDDLDARLFVVGTRRRGFGESMREFLTGSVAARLTHRQRRPVLVVPLGRPLADDVATWAG